MALLHKPSCANWYLAQGDAIGRQLLPGGSQLRLNVAGDRLVEPGKAIRAVCVERLLAQHAACLFSLGRKRIVRIRFLAEGNRSGQQTQPRSGSDGLHWLSAEPGCGQRGRLLHQRGYLCDRLCNTCHDLPCDACRKGIDGRVDGFQIGDALLVLLEDFLWIGGPQLSVESTL